MAVATFPVAIVSVDVPEWGREAAGIGMAAIGAAATGMAATGAVAIGMGETGVVAIGTAVTGTTGTAATGIIGTGGTIGTAMISSSLVAIRMDIMEATHMVMVTGLATAMEDTPMATVMALGILRMIQKNSPVSTNGSAG